MNPAAVATLRQTAYDLRKEARRAERKVASLIAEAVAWDTKAKGLRSAADTIQQALAEEADK